MNVQGMYGEIAVASGTFKKLQFVGNVTNHISFVLKNIN